MLNKVENIVAKGEIVHDEQFQLWLQCFQKLSAAIASKCVYRTGGKGLKTHVYRYTSDNFLKQHCGIKSSEATCYILFNSFH